MVFFLVDSDINSDEVETSALVWRSKQWNKSLKTLLITCIKSYTNGWSLFRLVCCSGSHCKIVCWKFPIRISVEALITMTEYFVLFFSLFRQMPARQKCCKLEKKTVSFHISCNSLSIPICHRIESKISAGERPCSMSFKTADIHYFTSVISKKRATALLGSLGNICVWNSGDLRPCTSTVHEGKYSHSTLK